MQSTGTQPMTGQIGMNLALIAVAVAALGLALAYGLDALSRRAPDAARLDDRGEVFTRSLGGHELTIPKSWFRFAEQPVDGFVDRIELSLPLALGPDGAQRIIEVTLAPPSKARPSARLLDGVYVHRFLPGEFNDVPGLIGKPLAPEDGFTGEVVWYDALSAEPFVAKCAPQVSGEGPDECLRTVTLAPGIGAIYAFPADALPAWRQFDAAIGPWLVRIGAVAP